MTHEASRSVDVQDLSAQLVLTDAERAAIDVRARKELIQVISAQALIGALVAIVAGLVAGRASAMSALAGAGAYFVPNLLFALRLFIATHQTKSANPLVFLVGEMLKIGATIALLWMIFRVGGDQVRWLAVVVGLVGVVKAYLLVMALGSIKPGGKKK